MKFFEVSKGNSHSISHAMSIADSKRRKRQEILYQISCMTDTQKREESAAICQQLLPLLSSESGSICAYMPLPDEVDILPLLEELLRNGSTLRQSSGQAQLTMTRLHHLFLPRFDDADVTFHRVTSLDHVKPGRLHIPEPPANAPEPDPQDIAIVLVPGRAFDLQGKRLGRGKGGYDYWIKKQREQNPQTQFWGIAFREQIVDQVPTKKHDQKMDRLITPE